MLCNYLFGTCAIGVPDALDEKAVFGIMFTPGKVAPLLPRTIFDPIGGEPILPDNRFSPTPIMPPYGEPPFEPVSPELLE